MDNFELEIIRPESSQKIQVRWIDVEGENGNFVVGPGHSPLASILKPKGRLVYETTSNLKVDMDVFGGMIYVTGEKAMVILDN